MKLTRVYNSLWDSCENDVFYREDWKLKDWKALLEQMYNKYEATGDYVAYCCLLPYPRSHWID